MKITEIPSRKIDEMDLENIGVYRNGDCFLTDRCFNKKSFWIDVKENTFNCAVCWNKGSIVK